MQIQFINKQYINGINIYIEFQKSDTPLCIRQVASIFNTSKTTIERHLNRPIEEIVNGRPKILNQEEHLMLKKFIDD